MQGKRQQNASNKSRVDQRAAETRKTRQTTNYLGKDQPQEERYSMYGIGAPKPDPFCGNIKLDGQDVTMEVDTGASVTVISEQTFRQTLKSTSKIQSSDANLHTYTGEEIRVLGTIKVPVEYNNQKTTLPAIVVAGKSANLLGRNWLKEIKLNWQQVFSTTSSKGEIKQESGDKIIKDLKLSEMLKKYPEAFEEGLGTFNATKAKIVVDGSASPKNIAKPDQCPMHYVLKIQLKRS